MHQRITYAHPQLARTFSPCYIKQSKLKSNSMSNQNFRAHFSIQGKPESIDFSISNGPVSEETKTKSAFELIKKNHPDFTGITIIISKVD